MGNGGGLEILRYLGGWNRLEILMLAAMIGWVVWFVGCLPRDIIEFRRTKEWGDRVAQLVLWGVTVVVAAGLFGYMR